MRSWRPLSRESLKFNATNSMASLVHNAIKNQVGKALSPYLETTGIYSDISVNGGVIEISELLAKPEEINAVLAARGAPFEVKLCHCKLARLEIPWLFAAHSILIQVNQLSLVIAPLDESRWSLDAVQRATEAAISAAFVALLKKQALLTKGDTASKRSLFAMIQQQLLDKADPRVEVGHLHVRYEALSGPEPFCAGLVLSSVSVVTDFKKGTTEGQLDLKRAGVYCRTPGDGLDGVGSPVGGAGDAGGDLADQVGMVERMLGIAETTAGWDAGQWIVAPISARGSMARGPIPPDHSAPASVASFQVEPIRIRASDVQLAALGSISGHLERYRLHSCYAAEASSALDEHGAPTARVRWQSAGRAVVRALSTSKAAAPRDIARFVPLARRYRGLYAQQKRMASGLASGRGSSGGGGGGKGAAAIPEGEAMLSARGDMEDADRSFMDGVEARLPAATVALWRLLSSVQEREAAHARESSASKTKDRGRARLNDRHDAIQGMYDEHNLKDELMFDETEAALCDQLASKGPAGSSPAEPLGYVSSLVAIDCQAISIDFRVSSAVAELVGGLVGGVLEGKAALREGAAPMLVFVARPLKIRHRRLAHQVMTVPPVSSHHHHHHHHHGI